MHCVMCGLLAQVLYNVMIVPPDGHPITGECQVHLREILKVKHDSLHKFYEIVFSASVGAVIAEAESKKQRQQAERGHSRKHSKGWGARKLSFPGASSFHRGDAAASGEVHKEQTPGHGSAAVVPVDGEDAPATLVDALAKPTKVQAYEVHGDDLEVELIHTA